MIEAPKIPSRAEANTAFTWDLTPIFADDAAWEAAVAGLEASEPETSALEGTVGESADTLLRALQQRDRIGEQLGKIYSYASMRKDADGSDATAQAMDSRAGTLAARVSATLAYLEPEILAIPEPTISQWRRQEPRLAPYAYYLDLLDRQRPHVRSAEVEAVMAEYSDVASAPSETANVLSNVDLTFASIDDAEGNPAPVSNARYSLLMQHPDRRVRHDAFMSLMRGYASVRTTLASTLAATVRQHSLGARLRKYDSSLEAALAPNDVPTPVYQTLVETVDRNVDKLHRYIGLRKRYLNLDKVHAYDLHAPLIPDADLDVKYADAQGMVHAALHPLGDEYSRGLDAVFGNRWIDVYENAGKYSGAYSGGAYATPPYILLNYHDKLLDVYTLAHELGHSLHSYFTRGTQPFVTGDYSIFVAEVASTLNEALLTAHLLSTLQDEALRRHLVVAQLDNIRSTIFRQVMFAEFELNIHTRTDNGEASTADDFSGIYRELVTRYHGPDFVVDEELEIEWARVPHFYYGFYVYQYATGLAAALALADKILAEGQPAVDRYLHFLRSGSSSSPIDLLRAAGVDMTEPAPVQATMDRFAALMDELEAMH